MDVTSVNSDEIWAFWGDCEFSRGFYVDYVGQVDEPFERLMDVFSDEILATSPRDFFSFVGLRLTVNSTGGDMTVAMRIGDSLSEHRWNVAVSREGKCLSACVFLLAAGAHRLAAGDIGIHRIRLSGSDATNALEMDAELSEVVDQAKSYMGRHGVSPRLVDDMMTIPSSEIRLLSYKEQEAYGLGYANAVQKDIDRNALVNKCGATFAAKLMEARSRVAELCAFGSPDDARTACEAGLFNISVPGSTCNGIDERLLPKTP